MNDLRDGPLLSSRSVEGEFATSLRERTGQARDLLDSERAEMVDEIGVPAAPSRLAYLMAMAPGHGIDVAVPVQAVSARDSINEPAR